MEIIDAHAHIYPAKIAEKATQAIGDFYGIKMSMPAGVSERLIETGKAAGITRYVVHSCATKAEQVAHINEFIKAETDAHKEFIGYMTLHQDMTEEEVDAEVARCINMGFKGVKLHPDFQKFYIDGENAEKFYRVIGDRLPILFHTGDDRYEFSKPYRLANMAKKYKNVRFIGAHFGGYRCWEKLDCYRGLKNVWFDTSSSLPFISKEKAESLIKSFGVEKFFFGTDFPMWNAQKERERFESLALSDDEKEKIYSVNLKNLLNLK